MKHVSCVFASLMLLAVVTACDDPGAADTDTNTPPIAAAGANQVVATGAQVSLDAAGSSDAEGDELTYSWTLASRPGWSAASLAVTAATATFTADVEGSYIVVLVVNDGTSDSERDTVVITASNAAVAEAGPDQDVETGAIITLDGSASIPTSSAPLTYAWAFVSVPGSSAAALSDATVVAPTFVADVSGAYVVGLTVVDAGTSSTQDAVTVTAAARIGTGLVPDTGQIHCYDQVGGGPQSCLGTGQDGEYSIHPPSLSDNQNGTVTDHVTGLMWQRCSNGQNDDLLCTGNAATPNWYVASGTYHPVHNLALTSTCGDLVVGGFTDWRLPTIKELQTIPDYAQANCVGGAAIGTFFPGTELGPYWSTTGGSNPDFFDAAWTVDFLAGESDYAWQKATAGYSRCVRGESPPPSFTDNADGTVTDNVTGLVWQEQFALGRSTLEALDYCNGLALVGQTDWRLPNVRELQTLIDHGTWDPSTYGAFPDPSYFTVLHSSTTLCYQSLGGSTYRVRLGEGFTEFAGPSVDAEVMCVRGN